MDCIKAGKLIQNLRKEKKMTQKQVADALNISDKTVSKWECGLGCPDVSLLGELSNILGTNIEKILMGDLAPNDRDTGNLRKIKFYVCPDCGDIIYSTGNPEISCCGRRLEVLANNKTEEGHQIVVEEVEDDYYVSIKHEMKKEHYISFIAYVSYDQVLLVKLYPEQNAEIRIPRRQRGTFYAYCSKHGLFSKR